MIKKTPKQAYFNIFLFVQNLMKEEKNKPISRILYHTQGRILIIYLR